MKTSRGPGKGFREAVEASFYRYEGFDLRMILPLFFATKHQKVGTPGFSLRTGDCSTQALELNYFWGFLDCDTSQTPVVQSAEGWSEETPWAL